MRLDRSGEEAALERCAAALEAGDLAVLPTDTVYGLAARADAPGAVAAVFAVKGRDSAKSLVVMVGDPREALRLAVPEERASLGRLAALWPGPLTVVVRAVDIPWREYLAPGTDTLGIRVPAHAFLLRLLTRSGPLAVTSANLSGRDAPRSFAEIDPVLLDRVALALDAGECGSGTPSTVVEIRGSEYALLRRGEIGEDVISALLRGEGPAPAGRGAGEEKGKGF